MEYYPFEASFTKTEFDLALFDEGEPLLEIDHAVV